MKVDQVEVVTKKIKTRKKRRSIYLHLELNMKAAQIDFTKQLQQTTITHSTDVVGLKLVFPIFNLFFLVLIQLEAMAKHK